MSLPVIADGTALRIWERAVDEFPPPDGFHTLTVAHIRGCERRRVESRSFVYADQVSYTVACPHGQAGIALGSGAWGEMVRRARQAQS